jgi:dipeptidyl aminopeptidase/acylaminoacyl peptidase
MLKPWEDAMKQTLYRSGNFARWRKRLLRLLAVTFVLYMAAIVVLSQMVVAPPRTSIGETSRPVLGLILDASEPGEKGRLGVHVRRVVSPAKEAGLRPGDRIIGVNGQPANDTASITVLIHAGRKGQPVTIAALRTADDGSDIRVLVDIVPDYRPLSPYDQGLEYEDVAFHDSRGLTLHGWYVPPPASLEGNSSRRASGVVYGHGNGTDRRHWLPLVWELHQAGLGQLFIDFAGRGESDGKTISMGVHEADAMIAGLDFLENRPEIDAGRLALAGRSMGAAAACLAAGQDPRVRALVLDSPYTSLSRELDHVIAGYGLPPILIRPALLAVSSFRARTELSQVRPLDALDGYNGPVILFHGQDDHIVPMVHALEFKNRTGDRMELVLMEATGHNFARPADYADRIVAFLEQAMDG